MAQYALLKKLSMQCSSNHGIETLQVKELNFKNKVFLSIKYWVYKRK